jgi:hypothetical protein
MDLHSFNIISIIIIGNASFITYDPQMDIDKSLDMAAHESYHAMEFWGNSISSRAEIASLGVAPLSMAIGFMTSHFGIIPLGAMGSLISLGLLHHPEEIKAHSFGALFHPQSYRPSTDLSSDKKQKPMTLKEIFLDNINGYPSLKRRAIIEQNTQHICSKEGSIFFSLDNTPDIAFSNWQKMGNPSVLL